MNGKCPETGCTDRPFLPQRSSAILNGSASAQKVDWDPNVLNRYLNYVMSKETSPYVNMTLMNPDPMNLWSKDIGNNNGATNHLVHPNVEFVRVQWRTLGVGSGSIRGIWLEKTIIYGSET